MTGGEFKWFITGLVYGMIAFPVLAVINKIFTKSKTRSE